MADDLERRLREPTPDEPTDLPPLTLPLDRDGLLAVKAPSPRSGSGGGWPGRGSIIGLAGVLVALAIVGAVVTGTPGPTPSASAQPSQTPGASGTATAIASTPPTDADLASFDFDKLHFSYPAAWHQLIGMVPFSGGSVIVMLGSEPVDGCGDPPDVNCLNRQQLAEGEIRVTVTAGFMRGGTLEDLAPPGGWIDSIDGMRAKVETTDGTAGVGADGFRTWTIAMPGEIAAYYEVTGVFRGPGADTLMTNVDAVARSFRFDDKPTALDHTQAPEVLRRAIDAADRSARQNFVDFYGCFPREAGEQAVTIRSWAGGPLPAAVPVTCASSIEPTTAGLWKVILTVTWEDGEGYAAGVWRYALYVDTTGRSSREEMLTPEAPLPEAATEAPAAVESVPVIPSRSVVEVLWPGTSVVLTPDPNGDGLSGIDAGRHLTVVAGPEAVGGIDWYRVQWTPTPTFPAILGWVPATDAEHHPLLRVVEAACPTGALDIPDLLALIPAERLTCFGAGEVTLGPVQAREGDPELNVQASPAWLAGETRWLLYGRDGIDGVIGGLRVHLSPDLAGALQSEAWYQVRGHFDDPSSSGCTRAWIGDEAASLVAESTAEQALSCREHFVVTSATEAPPPR